MLSALRFKFGSVPGGPNLSISLSPAVTIFVGPNNSGKSQALRELRSLLSHVDHGRHIIDNLDFAGFSAEEAKFELDAITDSPREGETVQVDHRIVRWSTGRGQVSENTFLLALQNPNTNRYHFTSLFAERSAISLDGPSRIGLVGPQVRGDLKYPDSMLARLLTDDAKRTALRKVIFDATGLVLAIDASVGDQLSIRFGTTPPPDERSFGEETLDYLRRARGIESVSDGIKAFTGILLQLHVGSPKVFMVDEPEAFLHPGLAFKLGKELARGAVEEGKHVFASTHSAQFLMGAITSGATVNIVRLTYSGGVATARMLSGESLRAIIQDPLLRSAGVLEGLFYESVVVGEANADRAFYQEVNERLLSANDTRGIPHTLFINADNKQTIPRIVLPLRKLGIPAAGVFDIDVLKDGGGEWTKQLESAVIPTAEHSAYASRRAAVLKSLQDTGRDFKREGGINLLSGGAYETASNLLADLQRYGLFVVERGEVESWLSELDVERSKNGWLRNIFERMGADPADGSYVRPRVGDAWDFIGQIGDWVKNSNRRGIPT